MVVLVERADAFARVIRAIPITPAVQQYIDCLNIHRAVRGTTALEGSTVTEEEVADILEHPGKEILPLARAREQQEVLNAKAAMDYVIQILDHDVEERLTEEKVKHIHLLTTQNIATPTTSQENIGIILLWQGLMSPQEQEKRSETKWVSSFNGFIPPRRKPFIPRFAHWLPIFILSASILLAMAMVGPLELLRAISYIREV